MTDEKRMTPMLTQYRQIKARFPDALVLFRLGDFYETFEADAKTTARELELVLTSRGRRGCLSAWWSGRKVCWRG
jgi:DNA mismatch repair protein MutS